MLTPEEIEKNWTTFNGYIDKLGDRAPAARMLVDSLGERLCMAPASSRKHYHNSFPGGLVDHSLRVLTNAVKISKALNYQFPIDSLIIAALFHDLGKVGSHEEDLYLPQQEQWKVEKYGEMYAYNNKLTFMTVPLRGIFLCQHFGLRLTEDEMLSIFLNDGQYIDENRPYGMKEPDLALIIHMADVVSTRQEKDKTEG